jgi:predicted ATPase
VVDRPGGSWLLRQSLEDIQAGGAQHLVPWGLGLLAEAELLAGRPQEALGLLDDALARVGRSGERMYEAELHRLRGGALLAGPRRAAPKRRRPSAPPWPSPGGRVPSSWRGEPTRTCTA